MEHPVEGHNPTVPEIVLVAIKSRTPHSRSRIRVLAYRHIDDFPFSPPVFVYMLRPDKINPWPSVILDWFIGPL
jgi:hypothetical protein